MLVLDEALPWPPDSGKRLRTWHLLRRLARRHDVTLLAYAQPGAGTEAAQAALAAAGIRTETVMAPLEATGMRLYARLLANCFSTWPYSVAKHASRRFRRAVAQQLGEAQGFDLVQVEWTPYAANLTSGGPPHLIASHNIETSIWRRRAQVSRSGVARAFFSWQAAKMQSFERRAFAHAAAVTTVSAEERELALRWGARHSRMVANGVDLEQFQPQPAEGSGDRILFLGALDWFANQDAALYFAETILPRLRARRPGVRFQIVGRRPPQALWQALQAPPYADTAIEMVGEVEDVRPWLAQAAVVVVPLRVGGGSRIKILESLAMEKPVVSTRVGAEGLEVVSGQQLLIADEPAEFARFVLELLNSPDRAARLGQTGGRWVREHHGWDQCAEALEGEWLAAARRPASSGAVEVPCR